MPVRKRRMLLLVQFSQTHQRGHRRAMSKQVIISPSTMKPLVLEEVHDLMPQLNGYAARELSRRFANTPLLRAVERMHDAPSRPFVGCLPAGGLPSSAVMRFALPERKFALRARKRRGAVQMTARGHFGPAQPSSLSGSGSLKVCADRGCLIFRPRSLYASTVSRRPARGRMPRKMSRGAFRSKRRSYWRLRMVDLQFGGRSRPRCYSRLLQGCSKALPGRYVPATAAGSDGGERIGGPAAFELLVD